MKVEYKGKKFDSELEVEYYVSLIHNPDVVDFTYHPTQIPNLVGKRSYTPDFIVKYIDRIEIVETKGYNPYSFRIDDAIHQAMLSKDEKWLKEYAALNGFNDDLKVEYKKIKYLQKFGWVDFNFKNPNTLANKRKDKISVLNHQIADFKAQLKEYDKLFKYEYLTAKITKKQKEWMHRFIERKIKEMREKEDGRNKKEDNNEG